jgi:hypothetical protein
MDAPDRLYRRNLAAGCKLRLGSIMLMTHERQGEAGHQPPSVPQAAASSPSAEPGPGSVVADSLGE